MKVVQHPNYLQNIYNLTFRFKWKTGILRYVSTMFGRKKFSIGSRFLSETRAALALNFAILAPVLLAMGAAALDFTVYNKQKASMQAA
ncbi:MAG: hypothetical protein AAF870_07050, partial [Pseudomonadota bacterium]